MPERPGRSRASAFLVLATTGVVLVATAVLLAPTEGCTLHNCDPSSSTFDGAHQGVSEALPSGQVRWASSAWAGTWMDFPGGRTITVLYPPGFVPDPLLAPTVFVSTGQAQDAGATSTSTSGSLDQFSYLTDAGFHLNNGTCADYSVWFSVTGTMTSPVADAGIDASRD